VAVKTLRLRAASLTTLPNRPAAWIKARERAFERAGAADLRDVMQIFGLRLTDAGRLMGVSRQSVEQWLAGGVPPGRVADVARLAQAARAMHAYFRPERIPQIARQPIPALDGRSVLEVAKADPRRIVELVEATRSYVPAA
jgi:transcriptional regulator with XRE-family HTH domain